MPRDLLQEMEKIRQQQGPDMEEEPDETSVVIRIPDQNDNNTSAIDEFRRNAEAVQEDIETIKESTERVREIHAYILSTPDANESRNQELEDYMATIKKCASRIRSRLKQMRSDAEKSVEENPTSAVGRMKTVQHQAMSKMFVECMTEYNNAQMEYRDKCKASIQRHLLISGKDTTDEELEEMFEKGDFAVFTQGLLADTAKEKQALADVEARHADIMKLEKSIMELRDMFLEMAVLVEQQGEMINRIEYNVANAAEYVEEAKQETQKARDYQVAAGKKKIWLIGILIVVILVILIIILV